MRHFSKVGIIVIIIVLIIAGIIGWRYISIDREGDASERDMTRRADIRQIITAQEYYYNETSFERFYSSKDYPGSIGEFMPETPRDPRTGEAYGWIDNTEHPDKYCVYANLEAGGYLIGSHMMFGEEVTQKPLSLVDCEK